MTPGEKSQGKSRHTRLAKLAVIEHPSGSVLSPFDFYGKTSANITFRHVYYVLGTTPDKQEDNGAPAFMPPHSLCLSQPEEACHITPARLQIWNRAKQAAA